MSPLDFNATRWVNHTILHPHWTAFFQTSDLPAADWVHISATIYITTVGITGFFGNWLLFWTFIWYPTLRSPSNMLIANLAFVDLTTCLVELIFMSTSSSAKYWLFGETGCTFYALVIGSLGMSSIGTMTAIAIDRYASITQWKTWRLSYKNVSGMIVAVWVFALVMVTPPLFGWSKYILESLQTSCTFDFLTRTPEAISFTLYLMIIGFLIPLSIITFCYSSIIAHIVRHRKLLCESRVVRHPEDERRRSSRSHTEKIESKTRTMPPPPTLHIRATVACIIIVCLFCIAWTPYAIVALIGLFGDQSLLTPFVTFIPVLFAKSSSVYNPIVYAFTNKKFRRAVLRSRLFNAKRDRLTVLTSPNLSRSERLSRGGFASRHTVRLTFSLPALINSSSSSSYTKSISSAGIRMMEADLEKSQAFKEIVQRYRQRRVLRESDSHSVEYVNVPKDMLSREQILILQRVQLLPHR